MLVVTSDHSEVQEPRYADPERRSFPIGQVDAEVQDKIPLESVKPRVIRPRFEDVDEADDTLELEEKFEGLLRRTMDEGRLVFSDVRKAPNSCRVIGKYSINEDDITMNIMLRFEKQQRYSTKVTGKTGDIDALLQTVVTEVITHCPVQKSKVEMLR